MIRRLAVILFVLALSGSLMAQRPGPMGPGDNSGWRRGPRAVEGQRSQHGFQALSEALELSAEQQEQFRALLQARRESTRDLMQQNRQIRQQMQALLESENPDPSEIGNLVIQNHQRMQTLKADQEALITEFRALLHPEQLEKLDAIVASGQHARTLRLLHEFRLVEPEGGHRGGWRRGFDGY
ncbi:MAG: periplasmic heavy metal sensor [Acidobacteriota bacterium]|nr:MAG: periplasmic heavy metal sensor [Acidobacteriota bacterium]